MKNLFFRRQTIFSLLATVALATVFSSFKKSESRSIPDDLKGTINISGAFALYPITVKWAEEFKKLHPNIVFNISAGGAGKGITDALSGLVDIGLTSRDISPEEVKKGAYTIYVTKDAVVPTFNTGNPNAAALLAKGVKRIQFADVFVNGNVKNWNQLGGKVAAPIHVYTRSDAAGAAE